MFEFADPNTAHFETIEDREFIRDMLIPLDLVTAAERMEKFGASYWAEKPNHDWDGVALHDSGRRLMTCRHWDEETRLCGVYEKRPAMCRDYPYYAEDCDYKCGYSLTFQEMWDRALKYRGPEGGTPNNIVRGYN